MTQELLEILAREGLDTQERIERQVMHDRTIGDVLGLVQRMSEAAAGGEAPPPEQGGFDFVPNGHIAGERDWCPEWGCRVRRVDRLGRFAVLWADRVFIPSYFDEYPAAVEPTFEMGVRYSVVGDIKAVLALKPLLETGVVRLFKPRFHVCPRCREKIGRGLEEREPTVGQARDRLYEGYVERTSVRVRRYRDHPLGWVFAVEVEGPQELIPEGAVVITKRAAPDWLPPPLLRRIEQGGAAGYRVPSRRVRDVAEIREAIDHVLSDVVSQLLACRQVGARYLTDRAADATFLDVLADGSEYAGWNAVLAQHLQYDMPIIESVPLAQLLHIRDAEHDAFLVYRDTMSRIIKDHIKGKAAPSGTEAQEIYQEIVRPALNKLNAKVASLRAALAARLRITVPVTATAVGVGLLGGLFPAAANDLLATAGALGLGREALAWLRSLAGPPSELRNENFYFLWRVARTGKKAGARPAQGRRRQK